MTLLTRWAPVARRGAVASGVRGPEDRPDPLPAHVGLWLDRCLSGYDTSKDKPNRSALYGAAIESLRPAANAPAVVTWRRFYDRWRASLTEDTGVCTLTRELVATSRVLLHPASNQSVTDGSILMHHTYGVPYLPGSAVKGVLRRALERRVEMGAELARQLFGPDKDLHEALAPERGYLSVLDALWIPLAPRSAKADWSPLALDIVNPHHPEYYSNSEARPSPADYDSPIPTHRLSLSPGVRFLLVLQWAKDGAQDPLRPHVVRLVDEVLADALRREGLGAWTSAGYGRFEVHKPVEPMAAVAAWQPCTLSRNPGSGELTATLEDGKRAFARGKTATELLATLPVDTAQLLRQRKPTSLLAQTEPEGIQLRIVALRPQGSA